MADTINVNQKLSDWVANLHRSIDLLDKDRKEELMKPAGASCAAGILSRCESYLGKEIKTVEDLIFGWNLLRERNSLSGGWQVEEGGTIRGIFGECGCSLVRSGLIELHPVQCYCSLSMITAVFSKVANRMVKVEIVQSRGRGDAVCEFLITAK